MKKEISVVFFVFIAISFAFFALKPASITGLAILPGDTNQAACTNTWFFGTILGNVSKEGCCGNDPADDNWYNQTTYCCIGVFTTDADDSGCENTCNVFGAWVTETTTIISNSGFETGTSHAWTEDAEKGYDEGSNETVTNEKNEGTYSLNINISGGGTGGGTGTNTEALYQEFNLTGNEHYLSAWVLVPENYTSTSAIGFHVTEGANTSNARTIKIMPYVNTETMAYCTAFTNVYCSDELDNQWTDYNRTGWLNIIEEPLKKKFSANGYGFRDPIKLSLVMENNASAYFDNMQLKTAKCCGDDTTSDNFYNGTFNQTNTFCCLGQIKTDADDTNCEQTCNAGAMWLYGTKTGSNSPCCGDDVGENFYNGTLGTNASFCCNANYTTDMEECPENYCTGEGHTWLFGEILGNSSKQNCCGDDGAADDFYNGSFDRVCCSGNLTTNNSTWFFNTITGDGGPCCNTTGDNFYNGTYDVNATYCCNGTIRQDFDSAGCKTSCNNVGGKWFGEDYGCCYEHNSTRSYGNGTACCCRGAIIENGKYCSTNGDGNKGIRVNTTLKKPNSNTTSEELFQSATTYHATEFTADYDGNVSRIDFRLSSTNDKGNISIWVLTQNPGLTDPSTSLGAPDTFAEISDDTDEWINITVSKEISAGRFFVYFNQTANVKFNGDTNTGNPNDRGTYFCDTDSGSSFPVNCTEGMKSNLYLNSDYGAGAMSVLTEQDIQPSGGADTICQSNVLVPISGKEMNFATPVFTNRTTSINITGLIIYQGSNSSDHIKGAVVEAWVNGTKRATAFSDNNGEVVALNLTAILLGQDNVEIKANRGTFKKNITYNVTTFQDDTLSGINFVLGENISLTTTATKNATIENQILMLENIFSSLEILNRNTLSLVDAKNSSQADITGATQEFSILYNTTSLASNKYTLRSSVWQNKTGTHKLTESLYNITIVGPAVDDEKTVCENSGGAWFGDDYKCCVSSETTENFGNGTACCCFGEVLQNDEYCDMYSGKKPSAAGANLQCADGELVELEQTRMNFTMPSVTNNTRNFTISSLALFYGDDPTNQLRNVPVEVLKDGEAIANLTTDSEGKITNFTLNTTLVGSGNLEFKALNGSFLKNMSYTVNAPVRNITGIEETHYKRGKELSAIFNVEKNASIGNQTLGIIENVFASIEIYDYASGKLEKQVNSSTQNLTGTRILELAIDTSSLAAKDYLLKISVYQIGSLYLLSEYSKRIIIEEEYVSYLICAFECQVSGSREHCCTKILDNEYCITCKGKKQASNCGMGYNLCEEECGADQNCDEQDTNHCPGKDTICEACAETDRDEAEEFCTARGLGCTPHDWVTTSKTLTKNLYNGEIETSSSLHEWVAKKLVLEKTTHIEKAMVYGKWASREKNSFSLGMEIMSENQEEVLAESEPIFILTSNDTGWKTFDINTNLKPGTYWLVARTKPFKEVTGAGWGVTNSDEYEDKSSKGEERKKDFAMKITSNEKACCGDDGEKDHWQTINGECIKGKHYVCGEEDGVCPLGCTRIDKDCVPPEPPRNNCTILDPSYIEIEENKTSLVKTKLVNACGKTLHNVNVSSFELGLNESIKMLEEDWFITLPFEAEIGNYTYSIEIVYEEGASSNTLKIASLPSEEVKQKMLAFVKEIEEKLDDMLSRVNEVLLPKEEWNERIKQAQELVDSAKVSASLRNYENAKKLSEDVLKIINDVSDDVKAESESRKYSVFWLILLILVFRIVFYELKKISEALPKMAKVIKPRPAPTLLKRKKPAVQVLKRASSIKCLECQTPMERTLYKRKIYYYCRQCKRYQAALKGLALKFLIKKPITQVLQRFSAVKCPKCKNAMERTLYKRGTYYYCRLCKSYQATLKQGILIFLHERLQTISPTKIQEITQKIKTRSTVLGIKPKTVPKLDAEKIQKMIRKRRELVSKLPEFAAKVVTTPADILIDIEKNIRKRRFVVSKFSEFAAKIVTSPANMLKELEGKMRKRKLILSKI